MILLVIVSFFLDSIFFSILSQNTILCPLCSMLSLLIIYPAFSKNLNRFYVICGSIGILYDICYANTLFLHFFLFLGMGELIKMLFQKLSVSILNTYWVGIGLIALYRIVHSFFFVLLGFSNFNITLLTQSILFSIILNSIYLLVFYFIAKKIRIKLKNRKYKLLKVQKSE